MGFHLHGKTNPHAPCSSRKGTRNSLSLEKQMLCACTSQEELPELQCPKESIAGPVETSPLERGSGCFIDSPVSLGLPNGSCNCAPGRTVVLDVH